jgi:hypothetical protein
MGKLQPTMAQQIEENQWQSLKATLENDTR